MSNLSRFVAIGSAAVAITLGGYVIVLQDDLQQLRRELNSARADAETAKRAETAVREEVAPLRENVARLTAERDRLRSGGAVARASADAADEPAKTGNPFGAFAQTFDTPEMRQMMRSGALSEAKKDFADLLRQWNLASAEADQFLQLIADRESASEVDALGILGAGKVDEASLKEQEQKQEKAKEESDRRLKSLLGDARFAEFEAFDAAREELASVKTYQEHLEEAGMPLTAEQRASLAKLVKAETPAETDFQAQKEEIDFFTKGMTDAQIAQILQKQEARQARIAQQAASFLNPDQIASLQAAFKAENEEAQLGLKMARNLFQSLPSTAPAEGAK